MKTRLLVACESPPPVAARTPSNAARPLPTQQNYGSVDQLLAPIALYPDPLLAQILMSAADPGQVTRLDT